MYRKFNEPFRRACCQRHAHQHSDSRCTTSQESHLAKSTNAMPYISPSNRIANHQPQFMAGRVLAKAKNNLPKCSIATKYVKLADTKIGKNQLKPKFENSVLNNSRGGSFDNRTKPQNSNWDSNINPFELPCSRDQVNQSENIKIDKNYSYPERSRAPLKIIENNLDLSNCNSNKGQSRHSVLSGNKSQMNKSYKSAYRNENYIPRGKLRALNKPNSVNASKVFSNAAPPKELQFKIRKSKINSKKETVENVLRGEKQRLKALVRNAPVTQPIPHF